MSNVKTTGNKRLVLDKESVRQLRVRTDIRTAAMGPGVGSKKMDFCDPSNGRCLNDIA